MDILFEKSHVTQRCIFQEVITRSIPDQERGGTEKLLFYSHESFVERRINTKTVGKAPNVSFTFDKGWKLTNAGRQ